MESVFMTILWLAHALIIFDISSVDCATVRSFPNYDYGKFFSTYLYIVRAISKIRKKVEKSTKPQKFRETIIICIKICSSSIGMSKNSRPFFLHHYQKKEVEEIIVKTNLTFINAATLKSMNLKFVINSQKFSEFDVFFFQFFSSPYCRRKRTCRIHT